MTKRRKRSSTHEFKIPPNSITIYLEQDELRSAKWVDILQGYRGDCRGYKGAPDDGAVGE
jgi:hypothetical protein